MVVLSTKKGVQLVLSLCSAAKVELPQDVAGVKIATYVDIGKDIQVQYFTVRFRTTLCLHSTGRGGGGERLYFTELARLSSFRWCTTWQLYP